MKVRNSVWSIGAIARVRGHKPSVYLQEIADYGLHCCQIGAVTQELLFGPGRNQHIAELKEVSEKLDMAITALWIPFADQDWSNHYSLGLVPVEFRGERMVQSCMISQTAKELGIKNVAAHIGFIPEDPTDSVYKSFIRDFRYFLEFCLSNGQNFIFETGQESVNTLERMFNDLDMPNIGINFDPANMLMYDKGDPLEVIDRLGKYIVNVHCKDGSRPENSEKLGKEKLFGNGDINAPEILKRLYEIGYRGPLIIEREAGDAEQQKKDIEYTIKYLEKQKQQIIQ